MVLFDFRHAHFDIGIFFMDIFELLENNTVYCLSKRYYLFSYYYKYIFCKKIQNLKNLKKRIPNLMINISENHLYLSTVKQTSSNLSRTFFVRLFIVFKLFFVIIVFFTNIVKSRLFHILDLVEIFNLGGDDDFIEKLVQGWVVVALLSP